MNEVTPIERNDPLPMLHKALEKGTAQFQAALPAHIPVERFKRVLLTAVQNNPVLLGADRASFFNSAMRAAQDGLLPDGRDGALVIYKTKKKDGNREFWIEAVQWMPMIGGIRKKVRNSGEIATWDAHCVYEKDAFEFELGDDPYIKHKPFMGGDRGKIVAAYSVAVLKSGEKSREVMSVEEIRDVWRKSSKQKDKDGNPTGPWKDHFGEMCRKTVARRHSKVLPMSTDLDDLIRRDDDLYDTAAASDKAIAAASRPQLADFVGADQRPPIEKSEEQEKLATVQSSRGGEAAEESVGMADSSDPETGEIQGVVDDPRPEFSAADAYALGEAAAMGGKSLYSCPKELAPDHREAWSEGWREADAARAKEKVKKQKGGD